MPGADVSRETPEAARTLFPRGRLPLAQRYADLLATEGVVRGLIGPREAPRLWTRHLLNCAVLARLLPEGATVCDVGSGAGLPGLVVAIARPDLQVTLLEPLLRRSTFLDEVVAAVGVEQQVEVLRGRAESLHGVRAFDVVTARAVAPLGRLLEWCMPLVAPTGALIAMKGEAAATEIEEAGAVLDRMGCAAPELLRIGEDVPEAATTVVRVAWADPARVGWQATSVSRPGPGTRRRRKQNR